MSEYVTHRPERERCKRTSFLVHKMMMFELDLDQSRVGETGEAHSMILPAEQSVYRAE